MKAVFIGSVKFSEEILIKIIEIGVKVEGIVTKGASNFNSDFVDLSDIGIANNIPYLHAKDINSFEVIDWVIKKNPDIIFCFGWSQLLKKEILEIPAKGVVGYHPARIPKNRGRHPLIWAIILGLEETASTFFMMNEGADTGDIISQKPVKINYEDYANNVYERIIHTAKGQIEDLMPSLISNNIEKVSQDLKAGNCWRKRFKEDGKIDFRMSSKNIYNLVRALSRPYIGAHIEHQGKDIKVWKTVPSKFEPKNIEPGKILAIDGKKIKVKTSDSAIWLIEHQFDKIPQVKSYL